MQVKQDLPVIHFKAFMKKIAETVIVFPKLFDGKRFGDHSELCSVDPVDMSSVHNRFDNTS